MARKLTPEDFIQRCRTNKFHEFTRQDINEMCEHFNQIYQLSQVSKHGKYEVYEFPLFIQHLGDQNFMAAGEVLKGALREYELVLKMSRNETRNTEELQKTNTRKPEQTRGTASSSEHNNTTGSTVNSKPTFPRTAEKQQSPSDQYQTSQHRHDTDLSTLRVTTKILNHEKPTPVLPRDNDNSQQYAESSLYHYEKFRDTNQHTGKNEFTEKTKQGARKGYAVGEEVQIPVDIYRRSLRASIMLHDNNPNISDLSDPNRPTKLTERFSELYSNEYTDLYEELEKDRYSERDIVYQLLRVVRRVYNHCQKWNLEIEKQVRKEKEKKNDTDSENDKILDRGKQQEEKKLLVKLKKDIVVQVEDTLTRHMVLAWHDLPLL
ncbi:hypothetical protein CHS0354_020456 [Potamilus streckersoni]|uniref:Uncharacterized protein n=1 Tax=Potamilus streckersoni TaxID=2493646 RepID=A0AAE0TAZ8_9BIVA|nr:hypothetical protein CHS0354_020456 [Potamilus streckersoni]